MIFFSVQGSVQAERQNKEEKGKEEERKDFGQKKKIKKK